MFMSFLLLLNIGFPHRLFKWSVLCYLIDYAMFYVSMNLTLTECCIQVVTWPFFISNTNKNVCQWSTRTVIEKPSILLRAADTPSQPSPIPPTLCRRCSECIFICFFFSNPIKPGVAYDNKHAINNSFCRYQKSY